MARDFGTTACTLAELELEAEAKQTHDAADTPLAAEVAKDVPIYDVPGLGDPFDPTLAREWAWVLLDGPGVLVLRQAFKDTAHIDAATDVFHAIIADEAGQGGADHFAAAGANARVWNALQKLCLRAPAVFACYFGNPAISAVCQAWLGPGYQMTAQVNLVRPGGAAQEAHRDYHLGFQTAEMAARFPAHAHALSPVLTLQGAVAHCDMPVESGPTKLLPFSQRYRDGYLAFRLPEFQQYFEANHIQLPLTKGDAVFFNPALFHAAGNNRSTDIHRMANLLQISSPMGRAMESVDRAAMCGALYPALQNLGLSEAERSAAIAACAEGYSFPTNLDTDPPVGGLAPKPQAGLMNEALSENWSAEKFKDALAEQTQRRLP
ncbi:MAG: phytanoyl-CoA dioxygenase family protein [Pseudomonadota bacterium]